MSSNEAFQVALEHYANGRLRETEGLIRQILAAEPQHPAALHLLGVIAHQTGHHDAAIDLIRSAIAFDSQVPEYYSNLGAALSARGLHDQAAMACSQAVALNPKLAEGHYNLGNALRDTGQFADAAASYRRALAINYDYPQAHNNLGSVARQLGHLDQAAAAYRQAFMLRPDYAHSCSNLGNALREMGKLDDAIETHRQAVGIAPARPEIHSNLILSLHYLADADAESLAKEASLWNERHAKALRPFIHPFDNVRDPERQLRIGIVSPDFRMHSVAFFLLPLLEGHDRTKFHITCYSTDPRTDSITGRISTQSEGWCSLVGVPDDAAAERIRGDAIDILVDLCGHTSGSRLMIFARKPAPLQVAYLGFPGTTGLDTIDYRITDTYADPPGAEKFGSEHLLRLPRSAWCFAPLSGAPAIGPAPALQNGHITFGSFNNLAKVTTSTMQLWSRILREVPGSRLLLKSVALRAQENVRRLQDFFADRGIVSTRIELLPDEPTQQKHLEAYGRVDIALDTYPYHGVTTTCEALWMGVPVVTLAGQRHAARVGVSLLTSAGHPQWVAETSDAYVRIASELASDIQRLSALRSTMRDELRKSTLMDSRDLAGRVESSLREIWRSWCAEKQASSAF